MAKNVVVIYVYNNNNNYIYYCFISVYIFSIVKKNFFLIYLACM